MSKFNPISSMQIVTKCPLCDFKYDKNNIELIDSKDGIVTLYLNCQKCKGSMMMVIMTGAMGITSISMISDLVEDDLDKIKGSYVEYDDVLEMHKFLKNK
ncbi:MAG: hypothetical protein KAQ64_02120 [Candidatus Pacebacteria bacterium]|nr:hypothetical protein [Candidatus Paceibacterota bacterium]